MKTCAFKTTGSSFSGVERIARVSVCRVTARMSMLTLLAVVVAACGGGGGSGGSGTGVTTAPAASLSTTTIAFTDQTVGAATTAQTAAVTLSNTGNASLSITSVSLTGAGKEAYQLSNACGTNLNAGASCVISVTFSPSTVGSFAASISIASNAAGSPATVSLSGNGIAAVTAPVMAVTPTTLVFADQQVNTVSSTQTVTLTNTGPGDLTITSVALAGANPTAFNGSNNCLNGALSPNASCTISVSFAPTTVQAYAASIQVLSNAAAGTVNVALSGNGSSAPVILNNTAQVIVDSGPSEVGGGVVNLLYTTVRLCAPGSQTACQTIDHVQVDSGSVGFRVLASVLGAGVAESDLGAVTDSSGAALVECTQFVDGYSWGPVKTADVTIGSKVAVGLNIQVIGDPVYAGIVPAACSQPVDNSENTVAQFGANGIIGVGSDLQDCGPSCPADGTGYSYCTGTTCAPSSAGLSQQVENPVAFFANDNNGVSITLPTVPLTGLASVTGTMTFGIGTETNNALGSAKIYQPSPYTGYLTTVYGGKTLNNSFIDSGSNGYFFNNVDSNPALVVCPLPNTSFFCPATDLALQLEMDGFNGTKGTVSFSVTNLENIANSVTADPGLAGPASSQTPGAFDLGLPFFFGRTVFVGFETTTINNVTGPFVAF